jgi:hypothetical protein
LKCPASYTPSVSAIGLLMLQDLACRRLPDIDDRVPGDGVAIRGLGAFVPPKREEAPPLCPNLPKCRHLLGA